jgi:pimeloyl-ACP methyl ester carboxylesterase
MNMIRLTKYVGALPAIATQTILQLDYQSSADGYEDWALIHPPKNSDTWIVCIHGHGSHGDQLYTREDIRDQWLPIFLQNGYGILTPNLRNNAWMNPQAATDAHDLIDYLRHSYNAQRFIFASGSMGGTSNLIYARLQPEDVSAVIALGAASDLASYVGWCRSKNTGIIKEIADAIETAYCNQSQIRSAIYKKHSVLENASKLTMPVYLSHGGADEIIPVEQSRALAHKMSGNENFTYEEIPNGNHDSPLMLMQKAFTWLELAGY